MRKTVVIALLLTFLVPLAMAQKKPDLPLRYKKWLDEEVVYIITARERAVFLQLRTDKERDIFVEAFWKQRDPSPGTPRNEFEEEHNRRLNHANSYYGRSTPLPGWRTDRGRIYIILGAPRNIEQYDSVNGVYPTEIWFYLGDPDLGLPTAFNVIFFKRDGGGDYVLYSPTEHGPRALIAGSMGGYRDVTRTSAAMTNDQAAYKELKELEPNLAQQILSLIPGESVQPGYESLASNRLMATIFNAPAEEGRGRLRRRHPQVQGLRRGRVHRQLRRERGPGPGHPRRDGREPRPLHHRAGPDLRRGGRGPVRPALPADGTRLRRGGEDRLPVRQGLPLQPEPGRARGRPGQVHLHPGRLSPGPRELQLRHPAQERRLQGVHGRGPDDRRPRSGRAAGPGLPSSRLRRETQAAGARERVPFKVGDAQLLTQTRKIVRRQGHPRPLRPALRPDRRPQGFRHPPHEFLREDAEHLTRTSRLADVPPRESSTSSP